MTTENGSSRSQAQVHRQVQGDRRTAAAKAIGHIIRSQIVAAAVRLNYGAGTPVPQIHLAGHDDVDVAQLAAAIEKLVKLGLPVSIPWLYKIFGMPTPKAGESVIGPGTPVMVPADVTKARIARERFRVAAGSRRRLLLLEEDAEDELLAEDEAGGAAVAAPRRLLS